MSGKISIGSQIEEVEYELKQRKDVYERIVSNHPSRRSELEFHTARMHAVFESLQWLKDNRPAIVEYIKSKPPKKDEAA